MGDSNDLHFKEGDPGAVRHGNFINYYQFHTPEQRMKNFPTQFWNVESGQNITCLDIGCNTGELTVALFKFLSTHLEESTANVIDKVESTFCQGKTSKCVFLAIDIDPVLIQRAQEANIYGDNVTYQCLDFMSSEKHKIVTSFLNKCGNIQFDIIFCFSVTMWIHLNHGDEGLKQFLIDVTKLTKVLVIEPQPWKCYRNAVRRLKRSSGEEFPKYNTLKLRNHVEEEIENIIIRDCGFKKLLETPQTSWGRRLFFFKR